MKKKVVATLLSAAMAVSAMAGFATTVSAEEVVKLKALACLHPLTQDVTDMEYVTKMPAAYALSRKNFSTRNKIMLYFVFTMFFSGGLVPTYMTVSSLGRSPQNGS